MRAEQQHESRWAAIVSIATKIGCTAETLRRWMRQHEKGAGKREGLTAVSSTCRSCWATQTPRMSIRYAHLSMDTMQEASNAAALNVA